MNFSKNSKNSGIIRILLKFSKYFVNIIWECLRLFLKIIFCYLKFIKYVNQQEQDT